MDTVSGDIVTWREPGHFVSEPVFVPTPDSADDNEEDGVVIFTLLSPSALNFVQVVVLEARSFEELARITFRAKGTVTEGFHGVFVPEATGFQGY